MNEDSAAIRVRPADLSRPADARDYLELLDAYARDPLGANRPLAEEVRRRVITDLRGHPTASLFLAFEAGRAVGFATCFRGYSTFRARPLLNIHDIAVLPDRRGRGIGRRLLEAVAEHGRRLGCCRLTLEVREDNAEAKGLYRSFGFGAARVDGGEVQYLFLERGLEVE